MREAAAELAPINYHDLVLDLVEPSLRQFVLHQLRWQGSCVLIIKQNSNFTLSKAMARGVRSGIVHCVCKLSALLNQGMQDS